MGEHGSLTAISDAEYESIEAAVVETERGRWFLAEFARRNRTADTNVLLTAISRLEHAVTGERAAQNMDRFRFDLMEMAKAIARTKGEIAAIQSPDLEQSRLMEASESLDAIIRTTERATSEILEAAEHVQEAAWTLREKGADEDLCNELDRRATEIYTACSFQDLTAQRTGKIVNALRYLEGRINAMIDIWGADEQPAPAPEHAAHAEVEHEELSQTDVDTVIVAAVPFAETQCHEEPQTSPPILIESAADIGFMEADVDTAEPEQPPAPEPVETSGESEDDLDFIDGAPDLPDPDPLPAAPTISRGLLDSSDDDIEFVDTAPEPPPPPAKSGPAQLTIVQAAPLSAAAASILDVFAEIEGLDTREKLRRFT